jgi:hypothetical protein
MTPLYENPRAWRARIVQVAMWAFTAAMIWIAIDPATAQVSSPGEMIFAQGMAGAAIVLALATEVFLSRYIIRITREGDALAVTTFLTLMHWTAHKPRRSVNLGRLRKDELRTAAAPSVSNQWRTLNVEGHILPYILDLTPPAVLRALK